MTQYPHQHQHGPAPAPDQHPPAGQLAGPPAGTDHRGWAVLAHLSGLIAAALSAGLLSVLGPLVIYLWGRDRTPLVRQAAAGSFNFNLTVWAAFVIGWALFATVILIPLAVPILVVAAVLGLYHHIKAAVRANRGEAYHYPLQIPVLR